MNSARPGILGLPTQGKDLVCALALHAVVLISILGMQAETQPQGHQSVLMAEWIAAEVPSFKPESLPAEPPLTPNKVQAKSSEAKPVNPKPREASVLSSPSPEAAPAVDVAKAEPRIEANLESKPEPKSETRPEAAKASEFKPSDSKSSDARPVPAAFSPGGKPTLNPDYLAELFRKLARHKVYPAELKKNKIEGRVVVKFTLAADGRVISSSIQQSSGNESLDDAALQMLNKASPLPAIPSWMNRAEMTLAVPVEYSLLTDR